MGAIAAFTAAAGPPPTGEAAIEAWTQVEAWVRAWEPPDEADAGAGGDAGLPVGVTLRYNGRIIGRGLDVSGEPGSLARASAQALREADLRLPVDADALLLEPVETIVSQITISLELGGEPEALPVRTLLEVAERLSPGLEGVIVRVGDRRAGMLPGMMLATGTDAAAATGIAFREVAGDRARELGGAVIDPAAAANRMLERRDASVYRVRVTHLAQPAPEQPPVFLYRGARVAPLDSLDTQSMRRWAASMASFVAPGRGYPGAERLGLMGALDPLAGHSRQVTAPPAQQAVTAIALLRYSRMERADPELARGCNVFATGLLRDLAVVEEGESAPWDTPHAAAAVVVALLEIEPTGELADERLAELMERCAPVVTGSFTALGGFGEEAPRGAEGLIAWALVRLAAAGEVDSGVARAAVRAVFRESSEGELVTHMPWIWWAEAELAGEGEIAAAGALRAGRDVVWRHQLGTADVDEMTRDFVGGMVFTGAGPGLPTWNTARPLAAMAGMLGDERVTPDSEFLQEFNRVRAGLRFLRQLTADEATGHMYRNPARAAGGVRAAPWDQSMPPDATSLTLLAVIETLEAMEGYLARQGG